MFRELLVTTGVIPNAALNSCAMVDVVGIGSGEELSPDCIA